MFSKPYNKKIIAGKNSPKAVAMIDMPIKAIPPHKFSQLDHLVDII
ncbi:MAG: hypothetical protein ACIAXF_10220 [Phycisphaerales bacterium JB063]